MTMRNFIAILIILAFVVGIGVYQMIFYVDKAEAPLDESDQTQDQTETSGEEQVFTGVGTLKSLVAEGKNLECTIIYDAPDYETDIKGSYFIAGENVRGDFIVPSPDFSEDIVSSIIFDGVNLYLWSDIEGKKYGLKSRPEAETPNTQEVVPDDQNVQYRCQQWVVVDRNMFIPPSDILFQDSNQVIQEFGTIYEDGEF